MHEHEHIDYVELPARDLDSVKRFFKTVFDFEFTDFGDEYTAFSKRGVEGGFYKSHLHSSTDNGASLVVFYSNDLIATKEKIIVAGGTIIKDIFSFPGGKRFHFTDPCLNEYAVWSDNADHADSTSN